ncbi:Riboflavin transporter MCH5 [Leucoagaricus sp. SymC.cos]|nr:Riboflavin transporter MCH5 [Leucoagaricus sp. SymC.cos]
MDPLPPRADVKDAEKNDESTTSASAFSAEVRVATTPKQAGETFAVAVTISELPEGGFRAWTTIAGAWLVQFVNFGYVNAFGAYQDYYVRKYLTQSSPSDIGWIGGVQICFTFSMGVVTGRLFDAGYFYWLNISNLLLFALGIFMLSLSHENSYYQVFLSHGVAFGLASGLSYIPSLGIVGHYFKRKRPLAVGIVSSGSALGAVIQPIMLNHLLNNEKIGFHIGVRISAAFNVFLLVIANCIMRTSLPPHKGGHPFPVKKYAKDVPYAIAVISGMLFFLGLFFVVFYVQLYAVVHGVSNKMAFYSLAVLNAASLVGRLLPGNFAPRFGPLNMSIIFMIANGIVTACMPIVRGTGGVLVYAIVYGLVSGGSIALTPALILTLMDDPKEYGTRLGIFFFFGGLIGLVATPISGALLTDQYHWVAASVFAGVFCIVTGFGYLISRTIIAKKKGTHVL